MKSDEHEPGPVTILIVEDDCVVRTAVARLLRRSGYRVLEATDGDEALPIWRQEQGAIELLLTDMVMSGELSGPALIARLRSDKPGLRGIIMSGWQTERQELACWADQGIEYLKKPFAMPVLNRLVREQLGRD